LSTSPSEAELPELSLRARVVRGVAGNLTGAIFNQGSTFLVNVLLARLLEIQVFGEYVMTQSTVATVAALSQLGVGYTATKYVAELRGTDPARAGRVLTLLGTVSATMALIGAAFVAGGAQWLSTTVLREPHLSSALMMASVAVFFTIANGFLMGALAGLEGYPVLARVGVISGCFYVAACATGAYAGGLVGAIAAVGVSGFVQWLLLLRGVAAEARRTGVPVGMRFTRAELHIVWTFAIPAALNSFAALPAMWWGNALLARQPRGYRWLALFSAANNFRLVILFLPAIVNNVVMSLLNYQKGRGDADRYRRLFLFNLLVTIGIVTVGATVVALGRGRLLGLFGSEFEPAETPLLILMAATLPEAAALALFQIIQSREQIWLSFIGVAIPCFATLAAVAWMSIPSHGPSGLATAYFIGWTVALVTSCAIVKRLGVRLPANAPAAVRT